MKAAFIGLNNGHLQHLYQMMQESTDDWEITAICEEDPETAKRLEEQKNFKVTHTDFEDMLNNADFDVLAIGEYFGIRGSRAIAAMKRGKHIIADKPLCITLEELDEIRKLSEEKNLKVGIMLDLRHHPKFTAVRDMIKAGRIGDVQMIQFGGQHPLLLNSRPHWYFEPGKHGGTINDIAIHAMDFIPWMTGMEITKFAAARTWQAFDSGCDCFDDAAQVMFVLENGCGVIGDVSYSEPDSHAYRMPHYWRITVWGTKGVLEFNAVEQKMVAWINGESEAREIIPPVYEGPCYLDWFLMELDGKEPEMNTALILKRARQTLELQKLADTRK